MFAIWSLERKRVEYYYFDGHNFGFGSAVLNFNAFALLVVTTARVFFAVACHHYFDDFLVVDLASAMGSAQDALAFSLRLFGQCHEPSKRKLMARRNVGLGVQVDLSLVQEHGVVLASAVPERVKSVLSLLRDARKADCLWPGDASSIRGKLGFIFSSAQHRFGRAALQPFVQREYWDVDFQFSPALHEACEFLEFVLPILPPLEMRIVKDQLAPLIVYSDAMFQWITPEDGGPRMPFMRIGFVVICPITAIVLYSFLVLPLWYFTQAFSPDQKTYIAQGEAVGALAVSLSVPAFLRGRSVVQFQDNTWALAALVHGYASKPDMGRMHRQCVPCGAIRAAFSCVA